MIAGPYAFGGADEPQRASNLAALNGAAWRVWQAGHVPVIGVNAALPIVAAAGAQHYDTLVLPLSLALAERCDAVLRIGGPSAGADAEVLRFRERGRPCYTSLDEIPPAARNTGAAP